MSAPAVERPATEAAPARLPFHLRILAALGRFLLRVRRAFRAFGRGIADTSSRIGRSPLVASVLAAVSVVLVGLSAVGLVVASGWWGGVEQAGSWQQAMSITGSAWVLTFGVPVRLLGVDYTLVPWGLTLGQLWLGHQAGRWLIRVVKPRSLRPLIASWVLTSVFIAGAVAAVSVVSDVPDVQTSARRALLTGLALSIMAVGSGLWRSSEVLREALLRLPAVLRVIVRSSFAGFAALVGMAAIIATIAAATSFGEIAKVFMALDPTVFDTLVLLVLSLGYVPVLVSWSLGYLVGAGVSLGPDVLVSPFVPAIPPTPLPAFPPLAALPEASGPGSWALPVLVVVSGAFIGLLVSRLAAREGPLVRLAIGFLAAILAAAWAYAFLWLGTGALGDGRLANIGPDPGLGALLAGVGLLIGALPTSVLRARRKQRPLTAVQLDDSTTVDHVAETGNGPGNRDSEPVA